MTTWKIGVLRPTAGQVSGQQSGFEAVYEYTGLTWDDTQIVKSWTPSSAAGAAYPASTTSIAAQYLLQALQAGIEAMPGGPGNGWLYVADNQAGLLVYANRDIPASGPT